MIGTKLYVYGAIGLIFIVISGLLYYQIRANGALKVENSVLVSTIKSNEEAYNESIRIKTITGNQKDKYYKDTIMLIDKIAKENAELKLKIKDITQGIAGLEKEIEQKCDEQQNILQNGSLERAEREKLFNAKQAEIEELKKKIQSSNCLEADVPQELINILCK
jgi:SMC interacting uncharacterized protein involved in chromosome segregation